MKLKQINTRLRNLFGSDDVTDAIRIMRLAGCVNYPTEKKQRERDYVAELVTVKVAQQPREYSIEELIDQPQQHDRFDYNSAKRQSSFGFKYAKTDDEIWNLLQASKKPGQWHNSMRDAIAVMLGRGWSDDAIRFSCAAYCRDSKDDTDLGPLIEGGRRKFNKPNPDNDNSGAASTQAGITSVPLLGSRASRWATTSCATAWLSARFMGMVPVGPRRAQPTAHTPSPLGWLSPL